MPHPLERFVYCPVCGAKAFEVRNEKAKQCRACGFAYYYNPAAAVAGFLRNAKGEVLLARRGREPAKGTLDLPGGFADCSETAEEAFCRELREETGLILETNRCRYLFSIPNLYPYLGFEVHTLDLFFEYRMESFAGVSAADDVADTLCLPLDALRPEDFGLPSIRKAVSLYRRLSTH